MKNSNKYLILTLITFIVGYFFLRYAYLASNEIPFAQEMVLIVLGTIVTIVITAALLNKQSEVEIEKEQRIKLFDFKSNLYFELIDFIEKVMLKSEITSSDLIALEFLTHKISIIASADVLVVYSKFIEVVKKTSLDEKISKLESQELSEILAKLCGEIRYDLITKEGTNSNVQHIIDGNIKRISKNL